MLKRKVNRLFKSIQSIRHLLPEKCLADLNLGFIRQTNSSLTSAEPVVSFQRVIYGYDEDMH